MRIKNTTVVADPLIIRFDVYPDGEVERDHFTVWKQVDGWAFFMRGMYDASDVGLAIEALQLCRNLTQAIDANPSAYEKILEMASKQLEGGASAEFLG